MSLLEHPVVHEFLHYKWRCFGLPIFMFHFIFYLLFVVLSTVLILVAPLPQGDVCSGEFAHLTDNTYEENVCIFVTQSDKTGLITYLKVSRNAGFKYLVCCSSPMVEAMCTKFSHVLHQFLTFQSIHCASSQQLSFPPF